MVADEMRAKADGWESKDLGHECGHLWTIYVTSKGHSSGVVGEDPPVHSDANHIDAMRPVQVRAHDLSAALRKAAALSLDAWFEEAQPSFTCPECGRTSWHPEDARYGYCGACHAFIGDNDR